MQRSDTAGRALALAIGLLLVVLGLAPAAADGAADESTTGRAELVAQLTPDEVVARPGRLGQPAPGGFLAVLPPAGPVAAVIADHPEPQAFHGEFRAADRPTRPVRAPPVSDA